MPKLTPPKLTSKLIGLARFFKNPIGEHSGTINDKQKPGMIILLLICVQLTLGVTAGEIEIPKISHYCYLMKTLKLLILLLITI